MYNITIKYLLYNIPKYTMFTCLRLYRCIKHNLFSYQLQYLTILNFVN